MLGSGMNSRVHLRNGRDLPEGSSQGSASCRPLDAICVTVSTQAKVGGCCPLISPGMGPIALHSDLCNNAAVGARVPRCSEALAPNRPSE